MSGKKDFILASGSPQRIALLRQAGYEPKKIQSADIDEAPHKYETPSAYVKRMATEKACHVAALNPGEIVLGGDTVVVVGRQIIQKAHDEAEQEKVMRLLSGKTNRVLSAVCLVDKAGKVTVRLSTTRLSVKKLSETEIREYIAGRDWVGCSGFKIEGMMEAFIRKIIGSYSGVVGLPLYETKCLLNGVGIR